MMKIRTTWLERVTAEVIQEGHIRQLRNAIYPLAHGYSPGGAKTSLTVEDAEIIVTTFEQRGDGGPKVTQEQADKGTRWLHTTGKRLGLPERFTTEHPLFYRLHDIVLISESPGVWGGLPYATYAPVYRAFYADGTTLTYEALSWMSGRSYLDFTIKEAA